MVQYNQSFVINERKNNENILKIKFIGIKFYEKSGESMKIPGYIRPGI